MSFSKRIKRGLANALYYHPPILKGRFTKVYPDDTYIVSYPKSGNTWVLFMVGSVLSGGKEMDFKSVLDYVPDIYDFTNSNLKHRKRPRVMKSHEYLQPEYPRVIHLVRDPRAVAVSYFFYLKKLNRIPENIEFNNYLDLFIDGKVDRYGSWEKHAGGWRGAYGDKEEYFEIKYEDLKKDTFKGLKSMCDFAGIRTEDDVIRKAIENSSMTSMKKAENNSLKVGKKDIPFVREGKAEGWKEFFDEKSTEKLKSAFGPIMEKFGYLI